MQLIKIVSSFRKKMNKNFVDKYKKLNKKNPEGISKYENNFLSDDEEDSPSKSSDTDLELETDSDDECKKFSSEKNTGYTESDTDVSSVCSEHSDTEESIVHVKNKFFRPKSKQTVKFKLLQEESDFEEET